MVKQRRRSKQPLFFSKRKGKHIIVLLLTLAFGLGGGFFLRGRVVSVADGDTLVIFTQKGERQRIRLYGVDAPESLQAGGQAAAAFTRSRALFAETTVKVMNHDPYGRAVALVTLPGGEMLNEELLRNGHAWVDDNYCRLAICVRWKGLEKQARLNRRGLWADKKPVPPWTWRKKNR